MPVIGMSIWPSLELVANANEVRMVKLSTAQETLPTSNTADGMEIKQICRDHIIIQ